MIKKYVFNAEVIGIGNPITGTSKNGKPYEYATIHFSVQSKNVDGCSVCSANFFDYQDLFVGAKVNLELIVCGEEKAYFII